ncbi:unnamed protein product [marine sediment metagenome]|uniref:Gene product 88 domain-containing protein n=1 Tax=marine sediment metagenome TaxID=412755 RepID=X0VWB3_9ZZZZ
MASDGCRAACLFTAGRGAFSNVRDARISKTRYFFEDRPAFLADLHADIAALVRKAARDGMLPAVRLNGTSDIPWERVAPAIFEAFPEVHFYDYTKRPNRTHDLPANYSLTFSRSESNAGDVAAELALGVNIAAVFDVKKGAELPREWSGRPVIDGDETDLRFLDKRADDGGAVIVGLRGKGDAKTDKSGFVLPVLNTAPACAGSIA